MFTIGEFSRLSCISARMLRHYDSIGLIHPYKIGEDNGYRYYDISQLKEINKIEKLKGYGFTLSEIKNLMNLSDEELMERFKVQYKKLQDAKKHYEMLIHTMETEMNHKEDFDMNDYRVITMNMKEQKVLAIKDTIKINEESMHKLAAELKKQLKEKNLKQAGPVQISYLDEEFNPDHATIEMQIEVGSDCEGVKTIPEHLYVTTMHSGPMNKIHLAYQSIMTWLSVHNEYEICGPSIERLIVHEHMTDDEEKYETAVMFPIKLK